MWVTMKSGIHSGSRHGSRSQVPLKTALGNEWHAPAGQTGRARISNREELRRHRLPSNVQVEKPAAESDATSCAATTIYHLPRWPSISTQNGIEPRELGTKMNAIVNCHLIKPRNHSMREPISLYATLSGSADA
jgi:hypothetical protein